METSGDRLTTTEYGVLGLLAFGESSGYDLARAAARSIGYMWAPSRSQIYKVLPRLVAAGYAEGREVEQHGRPDKAIYRITPAGMAALRLWVENVEEASPGIFVMKLFFAWTASPQAAQEQLALYRSQVERHLAAFEEMERTLSSRDEPVHSRVALRHGILRARATLEWAKQADAMLESAAEGWSPERLSGRRRSPR
ncbi:MAG TPA: PadR family transcriptional regulator [Gaiellaceae bacterium]|nr:PadR family transcriptional regulator [Gaiellaceae bacterium]